ncbi:hypothetical protein Y1Q_0004296 [Alligator mississippiensis]|uniref:Uncharacterized protein n=1 Tax=Alligator mississippiensis TaxID=8496 RepID=A0A151MI98_ALLMI|nr:hypothetical protein Y1Q_0004296 [Alligator mississippiensis]
MEGDQSGSQQRGTLIYISPWRSACRHKVTDRKTQQPPLVKGISSIIAFAIAGTGLAFITTTIGISPGLVGGCVKLPLEGTDLVLETTGPCGTEKGSSE